MANDSNDYAIRIGAGDGNVVAWNNTITQQDVVPTIWLSDDQPAMPQPPQMQPGDVWTRPDGTFAMTEDGSLERRL